MRILHLYAALTTIHFSTSLPLDIPRQQLAHRDVRAASQAITSAAPSTSSCTGAAFPSECATASAAAPAIIAAFAQYGVSTPGEQAALLSLMLFESGDFKYDRNHWPGVPGQGTRNMQSPAYNALYARDLAAQGKIDGSQLEAAGGDPDAVLDLLMGDDVSFGSAAWFLATQCGRDVRAGLRAATQVGYETYLTGCVGTTATEDRIAGWRAAMEVVGCGHVF